MNIDRAGGGSFAEDLLSGGIGLRELASVAAATELPVDEKLNGKAEGRAHGTGVAVDGQPAKAKVRTARHGPG
jgi:hypothetical protein